jgi:hypothetical protein
MRTCIAAPGTFRIIVHKPSYCVLNLRKESLIQALGTDPSGTTVLNTKNFPHGDLSIDEADWIYEIANPLPFKGSTYILRSWADKSRLDPSRMRLPSPPETSLGKWLAGQGLDATAITTLPRPLLLALATSSTDPADLMMLVGHCCSFTATEHGEPTGILHHLTTNNQLTPVVHDHELYEAVANNPHLPEPYRIAMLIRPGIQGPNPIVGDVRSGNTHVYEYLRTNSYIGGGHYAANMAEDAIRYDTRTLSIDDMVALRHLYYQRTYGRLAEEMELKSGSSPLSEDDLEKLRVLIITHPDRHRITSGATLWGWNFGFDFTPSGYRLHASHQQVHQQFAMTPGQSREITEADADFRPFSSGDMVREAVEQYRQTRGRDYFADYLLAITTNSRIDGRSDLPASLVVWEDEQVMLFVPKAQSSAWELQIMTKPQADGTWPGNILETDAYTRRSLDTALLIAQQVLAHRGARMVTTIEYSTRFFTDHINQPLLYLLLPKLPFAPGAFTEAQLRFICGHYPEDFAAACRGSLAEIDTSSTK